MAFQGKVLARRLPLRIVPSEPKEPSPQALDLDSLFDRHAAYIAGVAARLLGRDDQEVDDVVQEVFLIALRRSDRLYSGEVARPWLVTMAVRVVQRTLRRRRWRRLFLGETFAYELPASGLSPDEEVLLSRMYRVLDTIEPKSRIAWLLRHVEGERLDDIAAICGCSLATAKRRIASTQETLSEVLRDG